MFYICSLPVHQGGICFLADSQISRFTYLPPPACRQPSNISQQKRVSGEHHIALQGRIDGPEKAHIA